MSVPITEVTGRCPEDPDFCQPTCSSDRFLPSPKMIVCSHTALQTRPREMPFPSLTSTTLQGRGKAQYEAAEKWPRQMVFPKVKFHWQRAFCLWSVPHHWGLYSWGLREQLRWLTPSLWRAGRLLSSAICCYFCMAHDWAHGNLSPLWLPDRPFKITVQTKQSRNQQSRKENAFQNE